MTKKRAISVALACILALNGVSCTLVYRGEGTIAEETEQSASVGLSYIQKSDGTYEVKGVGRCTDTGIRIPDEHEGVAVTSIGGFAFWECAELISVTIGENVTRVGENAFHGCKQLTAVNLSDRVADIGDNAFSDCDRLVSVTLGSSLSRIGYQAFSDCESLTSVTIPDGVTHIDSRAFSGCESLTSVTLSRNVTYMATGVFYRCKSLTDIYYTGTEEEWNAISKGNNWDANTPAYTVHYNCTP